MFEIGNERKENWREFNWLVRIYIVLGCVSLVLCKEITDLADVVDLSIIFPALELIQKVVKLPCETAAFMVCSLFLSVIYIPYLCIRSSIIEEERALAVVAIFPLTSAVMFWFMSGSIVYSKDGGGAWTNAFFNAPGAAIFVIFSMFCSYWFSVLRFVMVIKYFFRRK